MSMLALLTQYFLELTSNKNEDGKIELQQLKDTVWKSAYAKYSSIQTQLCLPFLRRCCIFLFTLDPSLAER